jgi:hypothetical protein
MDTVWFAPSFDLATNRVGAGVPIARILTLLADVQHGVVSAPQLLCLGITRRQIGGLLKSGLLTRLSAGVYLVGRARPSPAARRMAGTLGAGTGARLADLSAVAQQGLEVVEPMKVHVIVPPGRQVRRPSVCARSGVVLDHEQELVGGIPCLSLPRALLDVCAHRGRKVAEEVWRESAYRGRLEMTAVAQVLHDHFGEPGTAELRRLRDRRVGAIGESANRFEAEMRAILEEAGLPPAQSNVPLMIDGVRLKPDLYIPERKLAIETDGRDAHEDPERQLDDARRDALYRKAGITFGRFGWWAVHYEGPRVLVDLERFEAAWQRTGGLWTPQNPQPRFSYGRRSA